MPKKTPPRGTPSRKKQHVELTVTKDVRFQRKTTGLADLEFVHNALPEIDLAELDTSTRFLSHTISLPFMVSCMTGGYPDALRINRQLAEICEELVIPMGVGSQRQALEDSRYHRTFSIVREAAPSIPIVGNIGASEVAHLTSPVSIQRLVDLIRADAFAVHLNPLQEFLQPEGSTKFSGVLKGIEQLVKGLNVPVIVKEIGAGLSAEVSERLYNAGVRYIDVAGAGGTSWAGVEILRSKNRDFARSFWDWGIPTAHAVRETARLKTDSRTFTLIASGGIENGLDVAKCIALGADMCSAARPVLQTLMLHGKKAALLLIGQWTQELRGAMFLTGSKNIAALQRAPLVTYRPHARISI
ncbi:MAG: type 2 isopentenyl-diphosphate Delta-isomerase [Bacteroidota bacterium]